VVKVEDGKEVETVVVVKSGEAVVVVTETRLVTVVAEEDELSTKLELSSDESLS
jgi:hypothetical protein